MHVKLKLLSSFLFLISFSALAESETIYRIGDTYHLIVREKGVSANRNCLAFPSKCEAIKKAKQLRGIASLDSGVGGKNPMSVICSMRMNGRVVIGVDSEGASNSFCLLPDESLIATASLVEFIKD
jgi:hypothetical protein